jgi:hypothetical protein
VATPVPTATPVAQVAQVQVTPTATARPAPTATLVAQVQEVRSLPRTGTGPARTSSSALLWPALGLIVLGMGAIAAAFRVSKE